MIVLQKTLLGKQITPSRVTEPCLRNMHFTVYIFTKHILQLHWKINIFNHGFEQDCESIKTVVLILDLHSVFYCKSKLHNK